MTSIYSTTSWGTLSFNPDTQDAKLATKEEYELADRCVGSVFEALKPGEKIKLADGEFFLDDDLDLDEDS